MLRPNTEIVPATADTLAAWRAQQSENPRDCRMGYRGKNCLCGYNPCRYDKYQRVR